ncbi:MAG: FAD-binding and (Fe-S)-binding domain-containing protein [Planctomycetota bacterium]
MPPLAETPDPAPHPDFEPALRDAVRGEVSFDPVIRGIHATDASHYQVTPACVVVPNDEADCLAALRVAHAFRVPITPRGGATALSGQTFGPGMVIDVSKHLNRVLEIHVDENVGALSGTSGSWARVQPGVVRDHLNARLKPLGLQFAPDPATSSRATVGGMIGNNSSGTRSIVYGKTIDHLIACRFALPDGTVIDAAACDDETWRARAAGEGTHSGREAELYRGVKQLVLQHQDEIRARYPKVMRRVSGYNLDAFVDGAGYTGPIGDYNGTHAPDKHRPWNLAHLIAGSEGTLGFLLEATVRLVPLPKATAVCVVHFDDELASLRAVPAINEHGPSAVELLDRPVLREAKVNPATRDMATWVEGDPAAVLLTEFFANPGSTDPEGDVRQRTESFAAAMRDAGVGYAHPLMLDAARQSDVWETRKLGLGLISNVKGPVKGQAFVEDACVPVEVLGDYIERLQRKCRELDIDSAMYAHASVGVIHFRPAVDLHRPDHRDKMRQIADFAFEQVKNAGGIFAGEHGDGFVRGAYIPRFFGDELYAAFRQLKALFDPYNLMNPGKIVDSPSMTDPSLLRYGDGYRVAEVPSLFQYRDQAPAGHEGSYFRGAVEQCNGVGACRKLGSGTMCPSYMATRDEKDTTRGRANALRLAMSGQLNATSGDGNDIPGALASDGVHDVLDLCLSCKACKTECPNAVDMSRLKADALQMRHDERGVPLGYKLIGRMPDIAPLMRGPLAWFGKTLNRFPPYRVLFEKVTGIDRRRPLPTFAPQNLMNLARQRKVKHALTLDGGGPDDPVPPTRGEVILFNDTYCSYMEPHIGLAAIELLDSLGYGVHLANTGQREFSAGCCQRPRLSKGMVREAKIRGTQTFKNLYRMGYPDTPIICLEPSCASALADDLPDLVDDIELGQNIASRVHMIDTFLAAQGVKLTTDYPEILLHGHCHQKALFGTAAIKKLFAEMPETNCEEVDSGCCGMAGSFGYEQHDLSEQIGEDRLFPAVRDAVKDGKTIVACGISCRHQLHDFLGVRAKHWVEVVKPKSD